jgi:hypothetical protein
MAKEPRESAEAQYNRIKTSAMKEVDAQREEARKKTARLRELRLIADAARQETEAVKKPSRSRSKTQNG